MNTKHIIRLALCCAVAACASQRTGEETGEPAPDRSGTVIRGAELSGNFLESLDSRVAAMQVVKPVGECPRIMFRGARSIRYQGTPSVYIDGTYMMDTCALNQISTTEVDYVEIFPGGNTARPGIAGNPNGLILIYRVKE